MSSTEYLAKAQHAAASARSLLDNGDLEGASNRAYYAMLHAARAALLDVGEPAVGKHGTIIGRFGLRFVKDGPVPLELGRAINNAQHLRNISDYHPGPPDGEAVAATVSSAEQFVATVRSLLGPGARLPI